MTAPHDDCNCPQCEAFFRRKIRPGQLARLRYTKSGNSPCPPRMWDNEMSNRERRGMYVWDGVPDEGEPVVVLGFLQKTDYMFPACGCNIMWSDRNGAVHFAGIGRGSLVAIED